PGDKGKTRWVGVPLKESAGSVSVEAFEAHRSDDVRLWLEYFTVPPSLALWNPTTGKREPLKQNPAFFEVGKLDVVQHFATSKDGTKIPYFEIARKDRSGA